MPNKKNTTTEQLQAEIKSLADILEEVLHSSTDKPKAELDKLRNKAESMLKNARTQLSEASEKITSQTKEVINCADSYVQDNPWTGVAIGTSVGLVFGFLLSRR